jgi:hypothetical protein
MSAGASNIRAGRAYVELGVDSKALARGLDAAARKLSAFGAAVRQMGTRFIGMGAAILAPMGAAAKVFADMGSELVDMSQRTGVSVEALSALGFAAAQSGSDLATVETGIKKMQKGLTAAALGSESANEALGLLNLTLKDLDDLSPDEQFKLIADRLSKIEDPTIRAALAMEMFGRSGTDLLPLFAGGAAGIEELEAQAKKLGMVMSTEDAQAAESFGDQLDALWMVMKKAVATIGSALVPVLSDVVKWITDSVVSVSAWLKANKDLVVAVFKGAVALVALGGAMVVVGTVVSALGQGFAVLATVVTGVSTVIGILGTVVGALVSPIGLVITAIAALGAYLIYVSGAGAKALAWLSAKFNVLKQDALAAWQGIGDALAAGDIGLAAKILWLTLKLEWQRGVAALQPIWLGFKLWFIKVGYGAFYGLLAAWEIAQHGLTVAWIETTAFLSSVWTKFSSTVQSVWEGTQTWLADRWLELMGQFDSTLDVDAAKKLNHQQSEANQRGIQQERDSELNRIEQERAAKRDMESKQHDAELAQIGQAYDDAIAQAKSDNDAKQKATQDELAKAKAEWQAALAEAKKKRADKEAEDGLGKLDGPKKILSKPSDLAYRIEQTQKNIGVRGTFSAPEARRFGAGGAADRLTKASEDTARNTKKILERLRDGGAEFD